MGIPRKHTCRGIPKLRISKDPGVLNWARPSSYNICENQVIITDNLRSQVNTIWEELKPVFFFYKTIIKLLWNWIPDVLRLPFVNYLEHIAKCKGVGGGGGVLPIMAFMGTLRPKGIPFSGFSRDFTHRSIRKGREICHLGLWKGTKG